MLSIGSLPIFTYVKIGVASAVVGSFLFLSCRVKSLKAERDTLLTTVDTVTAANKSQAEAIKELEAQRLRDAETVQQLMDRVAVINVRDQVSRRAIAELEKKNANVRTYLALPVPLALQRVLADEGGNEAGNDQDRPAGSPPPTVQAP